MAVGRRVLILAYGQASNWPAILLSSSKRNEIEGRGGTNAMKEIFFLPPPLHLFLY